MNNMYPKIIDNSNKTLKDILNEVAKNFNTLSIATGYWDLLGMQAIFDSIKEYKSVRILIGKEPLIPRYAKTEIEPDYPDTDMFFDLQNLQPTKDLKDLIIDIKKMIDEKRLEIRVYRKKFLHAKCYIFGNYDSKNAIGIIGSSNLTKKGLTGNTELNALEDEHRIVLFKPENNDQDTGHLYWFDKFWNEGEVWNFEFKTILEQSPVGDFMFTPYEMYIRTLYELYNEELEDDNVEISIDGECKLKPYQIRNVNALIRRLNKYGVAMLADSVGLGKTITAIEIIKQYIGMEGIKRKRVEIIVPKSLEKQWENDLKRQGLEPIPEITSLQNKNAIKDRQKYDKYSSVDLFVIDESHNLRNMNSKRYKELINWIEENPNAHVLLLTATPINNELTDITKQILLGAKGDPNKEKVVITNEKTGKTEIKNYYDAISDIEKEIKQKRTKGEDIDFNKVQRVLKSVLRHFVVRNTRKGLQQSGDNDIKFPDAIPIRVGYEYQVDITKKIISIQSDIFDTEKLLYYDINELLDVSDKIKHPTTFLDKINIIKDIKDINISDYSPIFFIFQLIMLLSFVPYRWILYKDKFYNKIDDVYDIDDVESKKALQQLGVYGILRTSYLKRLESSARAIKKSIERYNKILDIFESGINKNKIISIENINEIITYLNGDNIDENDIQEFLTDNNVQENVIEDNIEKKGYLVNILKEDIKKDKEIVRLILQQINFLEQDDAKVDKLLEIIDDIRKNKSNKEKILIFSFFTDTLEYLEEVLQSKRDYFQYGVDTVFLHAKNRNKIDEYVNRFAPKAKNYDLNNNETEITYLFSTDILSEGQNLQDCGIIINYDLHWNPVRMIQRNGRINRLGSPYEKIYIYNMFPEKQIEYYLKLVKRLEDKITLINYSIGLDQPVLSEEFNAIEYIDTIKDIYTKDDIEEIKKAYENIEEAADIFLSIDEYVQELKKFNNTADEKTKERVYKKIPIGKWGSQPNINLNKERPPIITSVFLCDKDNTNDKIMLFATINKNKEISIIDPLLALPYLKCKKDDEAILSFNEIIEKINCMDVYNDIKEKLPNIYEYFNSPNKNKLTSNEIDILDKMHYLHFNQSDIDIIKNALEKVLNIRRKNELRKIIRKINQNENNLDFYKELIRYSKESLEVENRLQNKKEKELKTKEVIPFLFYVSKII